MKLHKMPKEDLSSVMKKIFIDRSEYKNISIKDKESFFFIINRYITKRYPNVSISLNMKNINKSLALDLLFLKVNKDNYYHTWIWDRKKTKTAKGELSNSDISLLIKELELKDMSDIDLLYKTNREELIKTLKEIKNDK